MEIVRMDLVGRVGADLKGPAITGTYLSALKDYAKAKGVDMARYDPVGLKLGIWQGGSCSVDIICALVGDEPQSEQVNVVSKRVTDTWENFCRILGRMQIELFAAGFDESTMVLLDEEVPSV